MLAAVWLFRKELFDSFRNLWGVLCGRYARGYDQALDLLPRDPTSPDQVGPALLAVAVLETFLSSLAVRLWKRTTPAALALLPGILPCFILTDTPPSLLPLLAAVFSIVAQALSQSVRRRNAGEEGKAILLAALTAAGLLGLLLYLFPRDSYTPPITWDELTTKMDRWSQNQNDRGNLRAGLSGNPDSVDLSNLSALPNHSATVMQVKATRSMYLYLRGSSYADFDGVTWRRGAEQRWDSLPMLPYLGWRPEVSLTLVTMERVEQLYSTYQITALPSGAEAVSDAYLRNADGRMYYDLEFVTDPGPVEADEAYDRWVRDRCTQLPEETRAGVLAWWEENRGDLEAFPALNEEDMTSGLSVIVVGEDGTGRIGDTIQVSGYVDPDSRAAYLLAYAEAVAAKVSQAASYSRTPMRAPRDRDFCTWFLQEAEEGFCVHYASSCTALLRSLGIPARYVSGYVCKAVANENVSVSNLQAHAWVEAWIGGRWVQLEPTPGDATEFVESLIAAGEKPTPVAPETTEPATDQDPYLETMPPWSEEPTRPTRPVRDSGDISETSEGPGGDGDPSDTEPEAEPRDLTRFWTVLGVIGFIALVRGRRALALRLWNRKVSRAKGNDRARLLYRRILRLRKLGGGTVPEEVKALAYKATFSQHELTDAELYALQQLHNEQICRLGIANFWKRFWCKYVLAVI